MNSTERGDETRRRMLDFIHDNPGASKLELQDAVGMGWGTMIYNVDVLENLGRIQTYKDRGHVRLFDVDLSEEEVQFFCALRSKHSETIVARLSDEGRVQAYEVADDLGVSRKVIRRTMANMQRHGLLEREGRANVYYTLSDRARKFLLGSKPKTA